MTLYEELQARGLVAQITDNEIIDLINNGKATFYIGFDCTADSLTAGHFMALTLMKRLQMAGNKPIALIGGGTTMIGDPSGRTDMRKMLTKEDIAHNAACFKKQMEKFIDFSDGKALMLNNADWLLNLNYVELLRDVSLELAPLSPARAKAMINRLQAAKLLQGFRGKQPADIAALEETLVRLGRMAHALGERLVSLDLNPLMVLPEGQGVRIVDIVMQARPSGDSPKHLP